MSSCYISPIKFLEICHFYDEKCETLPKNTGQAHCEKKESF